MDDKDKAFYKYAEDKGFYIALRDLNVERSEWGRLQKLMREPVPEEPRMYGAGHPYN